ncbi:MAG: luciferase family protein [Acidimicrobiales bacterium]
MGRQARGGHFDDERTLDLRLTKTQISRRRGELKADARVTLRRNSSDWLELAVGPDDVEWAMRLVIAAVHANRSTAPAGLPPTGADLGRRRRFH